MVDVGSHVAGYVPDVPVPVLGFRVVSSSTVRAGWLLGGCWLADSKAVCCARGWRPNILVSHPLVRGPGSSGAAVLQFFIC
eukprot:SAG11_NODE_1892_length_4103_cov_2.029720_3_plen_81_part_00